MTAEKYREEIARALAPELELSGVSDITIDHLIEEATCVLVSALAEQRKAIATTIRHTRLPDVPWDTDIPVLERDLLNRDFYADIAREHGLDKP